MTPSSESENRFRAIAEAAADSIILVDNEGRIAYWNSASERLFGYAALEAVGKELEIVIPAKYHEDYRKALKAFKGKKQYPVIHRTFESEAINKDGVEFPIEASASTTRIGGRRHLIAIVRDITDRRRAQESVRETLATYKLMCDNQKDAIIMVDMETQRFLEVNKAATEIYGYSRDDFLKMQLIDVFAETDKESGKAAQSKAEMTIFRHKRKDGTLFPVEITGCALIRNNRKIFCAILRDISGRGLLQH